MLDAYKETFPVDYGECGMWFRKSIHLPNTNCFPAHWHSRMEILYIVEGSLHVQLGEHQATAVAGQTIIIMPHIAHKGITGSDGLICNMVSFEPEQFLNQTVGTAKYILPILRYNLRFCAITAELQIRQVIEEIENLISCRQDINPLCIQARIYNLIGLFHQHCLEDHGKQLCLDERFNNVLQYIDNHFTENISTDSLSRQFGYTEAYFCRHFKEITGITTKKYIRILRLEMAQKLLRNSKEEIKTIAFKCGFQESSYFSNCFKQHFGVTPQEYRVW